MADRNHDTAAATQALPCWRARCELGFDGIFGVAFDLLNTARLVPHGDASKLLTSCSSDWGPKFPLAKCSGGFATVVDRSPLMRALAAQVRGCVVDV